MLCLCPPSRCEWNIPRQVHNLERNTMTKSHFNNFAIFCGNNCFFLSSCGMPPFTSSPPFQAIQKSLGFLTQYAQGCPNREQIKLRPIHDFRDSAPVSIRTILHLGEPLHRVTVGCIIYDECFHVLVTIVCQLEIIESPPDADLPRKCDSSNCSYEGANVTTSCKPFKELQISWKWRCSVDEVCSLWVWRGKPIASPPEKRNIAIIRSHLKNDFTPVDSTS
ncbi:hypothetical protein DFJ73DRAFT_422865 [Zopfochytrium polystomum]|nr:hypothetical protein DFJ73DRAFT_422865 [Zopfochytrium polystomum]